MPYLLLALKLVIVPAGLAFLAVELWRDPLLGEVHLDPVLLVAALAANQAALTLFAARMRLVLRVFGVAIGFLQALRIHLQSVFYFFVLPMTVGLEVARFAKVKALAGENAPARELTYALVSDRLIGAVAALVVAIATLPFVDLRGNVRWEAMPGWLPWAAAASAIALLLMARGRIRRHVLDLLSLMHSGRRGLLACTVLAALMHACFALGVHLGAHAAGVEISFAQSLFAVSAAMLFVIVPVSFAGVSPVEAASLGILLAMGLPVGQAAIFAFISYLAKLVAAFQGGLWEVWEGGGQMTQLLARRESGSVK